jgi:hypothetical protein
MLSYTDQTRIYQEVVVGAEPPANESPEAKEWREKISKTVKESMDAGLTPDVPLDWEEDLE